MIRSKSVNALYELDFEINKEYHCDRCGNMTPIGKKECTKCLGKLRNPRIYADDSDSDSDSDSGYYTDTDIDISFPVNCYKCGKFGKTYTPYGKKCIKCHQHDEKMCYLFLIIFVLSMLIIWFLDDTPSPLYPQYTSNPLCSAARGT